jgi:hypothetical protein
VSKVKIDDKALYREVHNLKKRFYKIINMASEAIKELNNIGEAIDLDIDEHKTIMKKEDKHAKL